MHNFFQKVHSCKNPSIKFCELIDNNQVYYKPKLHSGQELQIFHIDLDKIAKNYCLIFFKYDPVVSVF